MADPRQCVCDPDNKAADLKKPAQGAELRGSAGAALHGLAGRGCAALLEAGVLRDLCARQREGTDHTGISLARQAGLPVLRREPRGLLLGLQVPLWLPL